MKHILKNCISNLDDFSKKNSFHRILWDHALETKYGFIKLRNSKDFIEKYSQMIAILAKDHVTIDLLTKDYSGVKPIKTPSIR